MTAIASAPKGMVERVLGPRPSRLGTRRRGPRAVPVVTPPGVSCGAAAPSLDTEKQLETSVQELGSRTAPEKAQTCRAWAAGERTEEDVRAEKWSLKKQLTATVFQIWQDKAHAEPDGILELWFADLEAQKEPRDGENDADRWARVVAWKKANELKGIAGEVYRWFRQYEQLRNCQAEWIGYRAACCGPATRPIAVPIGCRHRLCPLCCSLRAQEAKKRIRTLFDRLTHPVLITLTTPNQSTICKNDFKLFRKRVRALIKQCKWTPATESELESGWIKGGVYALETTFNRSENSWHIHCHILADVVSSLPAKTDRTLLAGSRVYSFTAMKLKLEFDWLRLTSSAWGKKPRKDADPMKTNGEISNFEQWVSLGREMRLKEWREGGFKPVEGITEKERTARAEWNRENRRVIDLRPVTDRDGAANEVLKYLTKVANFSDLPSAVEPFMNAVRSARLIQTFGTWYRAKIDPSVEFETDHFEDWGNMQCTCGLNAWEPMGVFYYSDVEMDPAGRWQLAKHIQHTCCGTVPRPTV